MTALEKHRPAVATVLDWEHHGQLDEVLSWAEEAARHVTRAVLVVPKVPGLVGLLPRTVGGKEVFLAYSVPTSYGGSPLGLWELAGWPVHLLGGSPQKQMDIYRHIRGICRVESVDGNMAHQQAHRGRYWRRKPGPKGHWEQLQETGDTRTRGANLEAFRLSLANIQEAWVSLAAREGSG